MKANKKFIEDREAVSAVIGVILMVAITVAIAATVYVYVSGMMGNQQTPTPSVTFSKDDVNDKLTIASADPNDLAWNDTKVVVNGQTLTWQASPLADGKPGTWTDGTWASGEVRLYSGNLDAERNFMDAADYIDNCSGTVTVVWEPTNTLMGSWSFT